jgi:hypothetical protein
MLGHDHDPLKPFTEKLASHITSYLKKSIKAHPNLSV